MTTNETKLGATEIGKSREFIAGRLTTLPKLWASYQNMATRRNEAKEEGDDDSYEVLSTGAQSILEKYLKERQQVITRVSEVLETLSKDAEKFRDFVTPLLPFFQTQQEMVDAKNEKWRMFPVSYDVIDAKTFRVMVYGLPLRDAQNHLDKHDNGFYFVAPNGMTDSEIRKISLLLVK